MAPNSPCNQPSLLWILGKKILPKSYVIVDARDPVLTSSMFVIMVSPPLRFPIPVYNADGQLNVDGPISEMITLQLRIDNHIERIDFGVTNLGKEQIFLGHDWLKRHNPSIDWRKGTVTFNRCPPVCMPGLRPIFSDPDSDLLDALPTSELEVGDRILMVDASEEVNIRAYASKATQLAEQAMKSSPKRSFEEMVPAYLHDFHTVFKKKDFDELPPSRP